MGDMARKRGRLWVATLCLGGILVACGTSPVTERAQWAMSALVSPTDASVTLMVYAGASSCIDYERVEVEEGQDIVAIRAYVRYDVQSACSEDIQMEEVTVELQTPLGEREVVGCFGDGIRWPEWTFASETDCGVPPAWMESEE